MYEELNEMVRKADGRGVALDAEVSRLTALLQSAQAAQQADTFIDKRLVSAVVIKCVEQRCSKDVLLVLASMLGCTEEEEVALGLRSVGRGGGGGGSGMLCTDKRGGSTIPVRPRRNRSTPF